MKTTMDEKDNYIK